MKQSILMVILTSIVAISAYAEPAPYVDQCKLDKTRTYCKYIGKETYYRGDKKKAILGKIIAVTLKDKGEPIEINPNVTAIKDGIYYVIDTDGDPERQIVVFYRLLKVVD